MLVYFVYVLFIYSNLLYRQKCCCYFFFKWKVGSLEDILTVTTQSIYMYFNKFGSVHLFCITLIKIRLGILKKSQFFSKYLILSFKKYVHL